MEVYRIGDHGKITIGEKEFKKPKTEIVERKGIGHPDTICDALAEEVSIALSKHYLDEFGVILHHNVDKGLLIGGESSPKFGGGEMIKPIKIIIAGRAVKEVNGQRIPVEEIAREAVFGYLKKFKNLDLEKDIELEVEIRSGSLDLSSLVSRGEIPLANDTSFGVGYWPLDSLESLVLNVEESLNSQSNHKNMQWLGEDIKVMGLRMDEEYQLTIAAAQVDKYVSNIGEYLENKEKIKDTVLSISKKQGVNPKVHVNTSDDPKLGLVYLTVTGLSAEAGDDGEVGRGNRANGLITPYKLMSLEASAGKNPVNHVGKIYNVLANKIAREVVESGADYAEVTLLSQIGKPINQPLSINVVGSRIDNNKARQIIEYELENITSITEDIINKRVRLY